MNRLQRSHHPTIFSVLERINDSLRGIERRLSAKSLELETAHKELDDVLRNLARLEESGIPEDELKQAIRSVKDFKDNIPNVQNTAPGVTEIHRYDQKASNPHGRGRKQLDIDMTKVQELVNLGFTVKQIADKGLLGGKIHANTLHKRMKENNMQIKTFFTTINNEDLEKVITEYNRDHPNAGVLEVQSYLKTKGITVQRQRCRESLARVDKVGTAKRWSCTIQRRHYSVPTANSVWHVDTHHSLSRWGIVVHGGIDGHSRLIPFMRASTFNTSKAAACFFVGSVKIFGVPSRVRADHGTEYADTALFMNTVNGEGRGSFLTGPSVHNQRIERLWRDVFTKVLVTYYKLFCHMEDQQVLDMTDQNQKWALQFVFTKRIDVALKEWMIVHNNHKIRTEQYQTPNMLWFKSLLLADPEKYISVHNVENPPNDCVEQAIENLHLSLNDTEYLKPRVPCPLSADDVQTLNETIDVNRSSTSHGLDVFKDVIMFVTSRHT